MSEEKLREIQSELFEILIKKSTEKIKDGSSEGFELGISSGFYDAACIVSNYLDDKIKEMYT